MATDTAHVPVPAQQAEPVLSVRGLGVDFYVDGEWYPAAIDLDYDVRPGEVLAIVGESGSGKTQSSMSLIGLLPPNGRARGSAKIDGRELIGMPSHRLRQIRGKEIAVIFQEPMTALNPVYTVGFQIVETLRTHFTLSPKEARTLFEQAMAPGGPGRALLHAASANAVFANSSAKVAQLGETLAETSGAVATKLCDTVVATLHALAARGGVADATDRIDDVTKASDAAAYAALRGWKAPAAATPSSTTRPSAYRSEMAASRRGSRRSPCATSPATTSRSASRCSPTSRRWT